MSSHSSVGEHFPPPRAGCTSTPAMKAETRPGKSHHAFHLPTSGRGLRDLEAPTCSQRHSQVLNARDGPYSYYRFCKKCVVGGTRATTHSWIQQTCVAASAETVGRSLRFCGQCWSGREDSNRPYVTLADDPHRPWECIGMTSRTESGRLTALAQPRPKEADSC